MRAFIEGQLQPPLAAWPPPAWDVKLLALAALYYHPSLDLARARWHGTEARIVTAGARPNPSVAVVPELTANPPRGASPWGPLLEFDVPIETAGKRGHRVAQARRLAESARLALAATAWEVRSRVRASLLDFAAATRREAIFERLAALQAQVVARLEQRLRAGAVSTAEVAPARAAWSRIQVELGDAKARSAEARARVAEAVGVPVSALEGIALSFDLEQFPPFDLTSTEMRQIALQRRADIRGGLAEYEAAQAALQLEIARQYPNLRLGPGYQYDQGENKWSLGLGLELPIFNQNQGPIAEARARRDEAAARVTALQARVIAELDRAVVSLQVAREQLGGSIALGDALARQVESREAQLKAGAADSLDLLRAQLEAGLAELTRLDAFTRAQQAQGALESAVQWPLEALDWAAIAQRPNRHLAPEP